MASATHPTIEAARLGALVFDLDGTMYTQRPVRLRIAWRLVLAHAMSPKAGLSTARMLRAYRAAQETLRRNPPLDSTVDLELAQLQVAAATSGEHSPRIAECVERWMIREPLPMLADAIRPGLVTLLEWAVSCGIPVGVASDYPAAEKLNALGITHLVNVVVTAQDADVQRFKPDPRGLLTALQRLRVSTDRAIYFGDRPEVDGVAADRAGVSCVLVGHPRRMRPRMAVRDFEEALTLLKGD